VLDLDSLSGIGESESLSTRLRALPTMRYSIEQRPAYSVLKVFLEPGESVTSEAGAMLLYRGDVEIQTHTGGGILKGLIRAALAGEPVFLNTYVARTPAEVWFAPPAPGDIAYVPLEGTSWIVQDTSYLAHHGSVNLSVAWRGLRGVLAEGELVWLKASGRGGMWICAYGGLEEVDVAPGERVTIDNFHFVAMPADVNWQVKKFGGWKSFLLGGEGLVFEVEGPAKVYVQTRILPPLAQMLKKYVK